MSILNRYLIREITASILLVMLALLAMFSFFDFIGELENIGRGSYGMRQMLMIVLLSAPGHVYEVAPVAVLVGTMHALGQLSRYSELIVMRTSGVSIVRLSGVLLRVGLMFAVVTFLVGELVTPYSEKTAKRLRIKATDSVIAQDFRSGLWVKDGNSFVNVEDVSLNVGLLNIHIYEFDSEFRLRNITNAKSGKFDKEQWALQEVAQINFEKNQIRRKTFADANWDSLIRPELLNVLLVQPEKMSAWNLYTYIHHLRINKQKSSRYDIALWAKLIYPLANVVMVLLALPFGFLQQRASGASTKIMAGMMLGIIYQVLNKVFVHLGLLYDWPALFSAITPTLLFLLAGVMMLRWVNRH